MPIRALELSTGIYPKDCEPGSRWSSRGPPLPLLIQDGNAFLRGAAQQHLQPFRNSRLPAWRYKELRYKDIIHRSRVVHWQDSLPESSPLFRCQIWCLDVRVPL